MRHLALHLAVLFTTLLTTVQCDSANPVQKVTQLITDLQRKVLADGEKQQSSYDAYVKWCGKTSQAKQFQVKESSAAKGSYEATSQKASDDSDEAKGQIAELSGSIAEDEADLKVATLLRKKERADFQAFDDELSSTVQTLSRAREVLQKELKKGGVKASFLQRPTRGLNLFTSSLQELVNAATVISGADRNRLLSLLQAEGATSDSREEQDLVQPGTPDEDQSLAPPKSVAYKSHSAPLLEALARLQDKADAAQLEARQKEKNLQHNFDLLKQSFTDKIATQNKEFEAAMKDKATADETRANSEEKLALATKELKEAQVYLAKLQHECMDRASAFEVEQKSREAELKALAEAKNAIQDANAEGQAYSFVQLGASGGMATLRLQNAERAYGALQQLADRSGSLELTQLSSRLSAAIRYASAERRLGSGNPFLKIQALIRSMVAKLEKESSGEANQKEYCDREMARTKRSQDEKADDLDDLSGKMESIQAELATLQQAQKSLSQEIAGLVKSQVQLDKVRKEEHAAFLKAREDFQQGLASVQVAMKVLRQHYGQIGESAALVQENMEGSMAASGAPTASSGAAIIGLLEVIESDFSKTLSEKTEEESSSREDYDEMTQQNRVTKATQEKEVEQKREQVNKLQKRASEVASDRTDAQQELEALSDYSEQLEPKCLSEPASYEARKAERQQQIDGLKSALAALKGEEQSSDD